jgi:hypothetical protein
MNLAIAGQQNMDLRVMPRLCSSINNTNNKVGARKRTNKNKRRSNNKQTTKGKKT